MFVRGPRLPLQPPGISGARRAHCSSVRASGSGWHEKTALPNSSLESEHAQPPKSQFLNPHHSLERIYGHHLADHQKQPATNIVSKPATPSNRSTR